MPDSTTESRFQVSFGRYTCDELMGGRGEVAALFVRAFGAAYDRLLRRSLGERVGVAEVRHEHGNVGLVGIYPFTEEKEVRLRWAKEIEGFAPFEAALLREDGRVVVMDFVAVARERRGQVVAGLRVSEAALGSRGFAYAISEVQWLRQFLLWRKAGWRPISPMNRDPVAIYKEIARARRQGHPAESVLAPDERFFWHTEPYCEERRWNVALSQPVYIWRTLPVQGEVHASHPDSDGL